MWVVLGAVIAFFFGDRTLLSARRQKGPTVDQVRAVMDTAAQMQALRPRPPDPLPPQEPAPMDEAAYEAEMAATGKPLSDAAIREWNRRHASAR